tara:strand:- start:451 stop:621 length:171 start_codon:yes stop_codon:yes gene_type:complete
MGRELLDRVVDVFGRSLAVRAIRIDLRGQVDSVSSVVFRSGERPKYRVRPYDRGVW